MTPISPEIFDHFAKQMIPLYHDLGLEPDHPLYAAVQAQYATYDADQILLAKSDPLLRMTLTGDEIEDGRLACDWLLIQELKHRIPARRLHILKQTADCRSTSPYDHPALADTSLSDECLVPLAEFRVEDSSCYRNGYVFTVAPPTQAVHSMYWCMLALRQLHLIDQTWVRLDPLMWQSAEGFMPAFYRMYWYGPPFDWDRISNLKEPESVSWLAEDGQTRGGDILWEPRGDEVHFQCEELPARDQIDVRGSRYLHAIFSKATKSFVHIDGAIRIYDAGAWDQRVRTDLSRTDKVGLRLKIFRLDCEMPAEVLPLLTATYFIWNDDVSEYFGGETIRSLLRKTQLSK